ncbi:hypothetical protein AN641_04540 [Candidatus Epulonipiscioides gigas]|nr:hypothetical protein AN641_04540 [Epulopiscium sp. SCG-C07WGA-EpuloA2]
MKLNINTVFKISSIILVMIIIVYILYKHFAPEEINSPNVIAQYIKENKNLSPVSFVIKRNDEILVSINANEPMPLASTFKLILAVEYANQVAENIIDPNAQININTLDAYHLPNTDGGAHVNWLNYIKDNNIVQDDTVPLQEVVRGMIMFSSNANSDFLMNYLGLDNINQTIKDMGLKGHGEIYPIVGAVALADYMKYKTNLTDEQIEEILLNMSSQEYIDATLEVHELMNKNELPATVKEAEVVLNNLDMQKIWSDRFIFATANDYIRLLEMINSKTYFDAVAQKELNYVLEYLDIAPIIQEKLNHFGFKNGSTAWVLTDARYSEDKENNKIEIVLMLNDLKPAQYNKILSNLDLFMMDCILNTDFRANVINFLS